MIKVRSFLKSQSYFILSMVILGGLTFLAMNRMATLSDMMRDIFQTHVMSMRNCSEIKIAYRDIAFRMAAYTSDALPAAGSRVRLANKRAVINEVWPHYLESLKNISLDAKLSKMLQILTAGLGESNLFFDELDEAYKDDDRKRVLYLLQNNLPQIQAHVIGPLNEFYALNVKLSGEGYQRALHLKAQTTYQSVIAFLLGFLILLIAARHMHRLRDRHQKSMESEIRLSQELLNAQTQNIQNARLASLGEMAAGVAHEINNPLAIIVGSVSLLAKSANDPLKFSAKLTAIKKSCDRISKIVKSLKKFSRIDDTTPFEKRSLSHIVNEVLVLTETKSKNFNTPITFEMRSDAHISCDEIEIEQVLVNLIHNAIDAVKSEPEKWIHIYLAEEDSSVVLRLIDSGRGIPEAVQRKLFDPFFTTKKVGEGTGLGLSITKGILDKHEATITILADSPHTCFEIRFPKMETIETMEKMKSAN